MEGGSLSEGMVRVLRDLSRAEKRGANAGWWQRGRLAELVAFARAHSPYFRRLYQHLPDQVTDVALLPVVNKQQLMAHFDDWVTDGQVTLDRVRAFAADPARVGERFLGRYLMSLTSGTTGTMGLFLMDDRSRAVATALSVRRMRRAWLSRGDIIRLAARGGRTALVVATNGHHSSVTIATRMRGSGRWLGRAMRVFAVHTPLPELVTQLNAFRPAMLIGYASTTSVLAHEQQAGRLRIQPLIVQPASACLAEAEQARIAAAFGAKVRHSYAATECMFIAYGCAYGWLHVNDDWVILEPVDADHRPVPAGTPSHTVLLTNLANQVQPVIRYDLGDSVLQRADPCPCGNPLTAIQILGRAADVLTFPAADGGEIMIAPLALETIIEVIPGVELFQVVQTAPAVLRVSLRPAAGADREPIWRAARTDLARMLAENGLGHVTLEPGDEPAPVTIGGKYRKVIPLA